MLSMQFVCFNKINVSKLWKKYNFLLTSEACVSWLGKGVCFGDVFCMKLKNPRNGMEPLLGLSKISDQAVWTFLGRWSL